MNLCWAKVKPIIVQSTFANCNHLTDTFEDSMKHYVNRIIISQNFPPQSKLLTILKNVIVLLWQSKWSSIPFLSLYPLALMTKELENASPDPHSLQIPWGKKNNQKKACLHASLTRPTMDIVHTLKHYQRLRKYFFSLKTKRVLLIPELCILWQFSTLFFWTTNPLRFSDSFSS